MLNLISKQGNADKRKYHFTIIISAKTEKFANGTM